MNAGLSWFLVGAGRELRLLGRQLYKSRGYCIHKWVVRLGLLALASSLFTHLPEYPWPCSVGVEASTLYARANPATACRAAARIRRHAMEERRRNQL